MTDLLISAIDVVDRHRRDLGDIAGLAKSISEVGLMHPIVVRSDGRLIAGARRLAACRLLGWKKVPVTEVDLDEVLRGELAENVERKDFLPSEIEAIRRAMAPKVAAPVGRPAEKVETFHHSGDGKKTRDKIGAIAGVSGRTVEKIAKVVEAAEREPEKFGDLVEEMDRTGKVDGAYRKVRQRTEPKHEKSDIPKSLPNTISPVDRCAMEVRRIVLAAIGELDAEGVAALIAELRGELDDIEQVAERRVNGYHAARQPA